MRAVMQWASVSIEVPQSVKCLSKAAKPHHIDRELKLHEYAELRDLSCRPSAFLLGIMTAASPAQSGSQH